MVEFNQTSSEPPLFLQSYGGDTSNALIAAARQGASVAYISKVGRDLFGDWLMALWQKEGVSTDHVQRGDAHTAAYFVTHSEQSGHQFHFLRQHSAASAMQPLDFDFGVLAGAKYLHFSGISQAISPSARQTCRTAIAAAKNAGVRVVYDSNLRLKLWDKKTAREAMLETLPLVDVFLPSLDDMQAITGLQEPQAILDWTLQAAGHSGCAQICLKMGKEGVIALEREVIQQTPAQFGAEAWREVILPHKVDSVDATGAGDCFAGSLLARLSQGDNLAQAARYANASAALSTTGYGAIAPIPQPQQVQQLLAQRVT